MESEKNCILVVDDEEINRAILSELLHKKYNILEAENGEKALTILNNKHENIAIVLLDIVMPVMDGFTMLLAMKEHNWQIPVVMITAETSEAATLKGYELGVSDVISKPFNPNIVVRRVENLIQLYLHKFYLEYMLKKQMNILEKQSEKLKQVNNFIIDTLSTVVEFRSCESGQHIKRIRGITKLMLEEFSRLNSDMNLSPDTIEMISSASALHDIGKIAIPDYVLNKPGRLTKEEFEIMKTHSIKGCEILKTINYVENNNYLDYCYEICRHHHERWDGRGYPDGISGDSIPIWSQIVGMADVYDALTSERVYKAAYPHETAISMIVGGECGAFNPKLLDYFLNIQQTLKK